MVEQYDLSVYFLAFAKGCDAERLDGLLRLSRERIGFESRKTERLMVYGACFTYLSAYFSAWH